MGVGWAIAIGLESGDRLPTISRSSVDSQPTVTRFHAANELLKLGRKSTDSQATVDRVTADYLYLVNRQHIVARLHR